jgi:GAF domain-containing protein
VVVSETKLIVESDRTTVALLTSSGNEFEILALDGIQGAISAGVQLPLEGTAIGHAVRQNQIIVTPDIREGDFLEFSQLAEQGLRSTITVPLAASGQMIGTLNVGSKKLNAYSDRDKNLMLQIASLLASTIESRRLFEQTQQTGVLLGKRIKELNCLNDIGRKTEEAPLIPELLQWVTERIPSAMQHPELCVVAIEFDGQVYGAAEAVKLPGQMTHSLYIGGELLGRIYIAYTEKQDFLDEESALLGGVASRLSGYLERTRLLEQSQTSLVETERLYAASRAITAATSEEEIVTALVEHIDRTRLDRIVVALSTETGIGEIQAEVKGVWDRAGQENRFLGNKFTSAQIPLLASIGPEDSILINDLATSTTIDHVSRATFKYLGVQSAAILPISVGQRLFGWLLLETTGSPRKFTFEEVRPFITLAGQAAVALDSRRLFEETRQALAEVEATQRRYTHQAWETYRARGGATGYEQVREGTLPLGDDLPPEVGQAVIQRHPLTVSSVPALPTSKSDGQAVPAEAGANLIVPLTVRDEIIGVLGIQEIDGERDWSAEEIALVEAIGEQLAQAAEQLRLLDETQQRATREQLTRQITDKIRASRDIETALKTAAEELSKALGTAKAVVDLKPTPETDETQRTP